MATQIFFNVHLHLGKIPILTHIFQQGLKTPTSNWCFHAEGVKTCIFVKLCIVMMSRAVSSQGSGKGPPKLCPFKKPHNSFGDILCTQFTDTQGLCRSLYLSTVNSFAMSISSLSFSFLGSLLYINRFPKEWNSVCLFPPCQTRNQNQFSILYRKKKKSKQTNKQTNLSCLIVVYRQVVSVVSGFFSFKRGGWKIGSSKMRCQIGLANWAFNLWKVGGFRRIWNLWWWGGVRCTHTA